MKPKILFGLPTMDAKVDIHYLDSMLKTKISLHNAGVESDHAVVPRDIYLQRARDYIAMVCLKSDFTHLFFIDADMGWQPEKVLQFIERDKDVIFGAYVTKDDNNSKFIVQPEKPLVEKDGLIKCFNGPTGFMCIKKDVFIKMAEKYPESAYIAEGVTLFEFFEAGVQRINKTREFFGEDMSFCHKWATMGGELWCDPDMKFSHSGQKTWICNYKQDVLTKD